jgi:putative acetyltransferase
MKIRAEQSTDEKAIEEVIKSAFEHHPHSNQTEHQIVNALHQANALSLSLVALLEDRVVGHIAFSKVQINGKDLSWYGLAPVSVLPAFQNQGIGSALIREGLQQLKALNARGCVLVGEPEYYVRFGFTHSDSLVYEGIPEEYFMSKTLTDMAIPNGVVEYHEAFKLE